MDADLPPMPIDLAHEPAFALGGLEVRPATLEVLAGERREQLEPRIMQVLAALARKRGEVVSRDELIATCWGGRIVGDDSINRCISRLRKLAEQLGGFEIATVPRVGFRLSETGVAGSRQGRRRWWLAGGVAAALVLVVAAVFATWAWRRPAPIEHEPRIALAAFEPLERDAETTAFARRLTDEVAGVLNEHVAGLAPPGPDRSPADADLRIGGSARREGDTLRVRVYLEAGRTKVTLWSRQYQRPVAEEDALRTLVAVEVTNILVDAMEPFQQRGLKLDDRTLALWLKGGDRQVYEQIVARAPQFAEGHGALAQSLALASPYPPPAEAVELRRRAHVEAERAIRIDPTAHYAYDALYWLARFETPNDIAKAEDALTLGLSRDPNSFGQLMRRCTLRLEVGRMRAALPDCERAATLRPLDMPWGYRYGRALAATGQPERAREVMAREVRVHPQHVIIRQAQLQIVAFAGPPGEALAILHDAREPAAYTQRQVEALEAMLEARASGAAGDTDLAVAKVRAIAAGGGPVGGRFLFSALVSLGRLDDAFASAAAADPIWIIGDGWLFDPGMEAVHRDPRFWPLAARTGLIRYWRTRGVWPDFCSQPGLPFDCATEAARVAPLAGRS